MRALDPENPAITYAGVLDALPIVAYIADPDGRVTYLSRGWERFTGNDARLVLDAGPNVVTHPDDRDRAAAAWDAARAAGTTHRSELRIRCADGSYRWVASQAEPMRAADGTLAGWFGTITDINDLREAENELAQALEAASASARDAGERARFVERLLDASDDCVKVLDLDTHLLSMSANGQKALAIHDFATVAGTAWLDFWSGDDRTAAADAVATARAGGRGRFTGMYAVEGQERWWDVTVTPIVAEDGRPEQILAISRDVSATLRTLRALERSEERYRVLGDALPGVTWTASPDGALDYIAGAASAERGPLYERLGHSWLDTVHSDDREAVRARWHAALASGDAYEARFRVRLAGGAYRWQLVRALPQRDEGGAILRWVGVNVDIDEQWRADEAREQFVRLVEASSDFIGISGESGAPRYVNEAGRRMLGIASADEALGLDFFDYFMPADRAFVASEIVPVVDRDGGWLGEFRFRNFRTGTPVPVSYNVFALSDRDGKRIGTATVSRDLRERYRIDAGLRALAETGAAMFRSLDYALTLRHVADAVTRSFATYCIVYMADAHGDPQRVATAHSDPSLAPALERAAGARTMADAHPVMRAIRHGLATLVPEITPAWLAEAGIFAGAAEDIDAIDARSMLCAPIVAGPSRDVVGALTCVVDRRDPRGGYLADDLRFAEELATRVGLAFDHARAYERERRIAVTLQEASLPGALPVSAGLTLSAEYRPGNSEATIGGDWYDAFRLDDGRIAITIGDVLGNGLHAAVTMGKLRQAMQSVAMLLPDVHTMLDVADRTVRAQSEDTYATALAGIYDPARAEFTFASAGHPGPALRHPGGAIEEFVSYGTMLGLRTAGERDTVTIAVPPGSALAFYTDGLVEATRDADEGRTRLHAAFADERVFGAENPARALVEHVLDAQPATDDLAVLVAVFGVSAGATR